MVPVTIPQGVKSGQQLQIELQGSAGDQGQGQGGDGAVTEEEALVGAPASVQDIERRVNQEPSSQPAAVEASATATGHLETTVSPWAEVIDEASGNVYYYNSVTHKTCWERPAVLTQSADGRQET